MSPKLSVIIPVFNAEKYLPACLDSVLAQTYTNLEIILVDDGSSDGSADICDTYALKDNRIHVIHKVNEGQISARREGLLASTCDYVTFVDADDVILPEMYTELMSRLTAHRADIITSGFITYRDEQMTFVSAAEHDLAPEGIYRNNDLRILSDNMFLSFEKCHAGSLPIDDTNDRNTSPADKSISGKDLLMQTLCTKIYRKELLLKYILRVSSDIRSWEDLCYSLPPFTDANCVEITHLLFYKYRPNPASTTHTVQKELAFARSLRSMEAAENNYALCGDSVLNAFYRKAAMIFYMDLWRDYNEPLLITDLDKAANSEIFRRIVRAAYAENKIKNKRIMRFLLPLTKGDIRGAVRYCKFSRFLTKCHLRIMDIQNR